MKRIILAVVDDMFFASKIRATAEALGLEVTFASSLDSLLDKTRQQKPQLVLVDLHNKKVNGLEVSKQFKSDHDLSDIKLLGFFSHVDTELHKKALEAGFDEVMPRSAFARNLPNLLQIS